MWGTGYILKERWVLQDQIAHGSYSTVWRAQDSKSEQLVAVKNLRVGRDLESAKRALREVEMLKHFMGSENILQIMDVVIIPGIQTEVEEICIVSELMDFDLHSLITPGEPLESDQMKFIMYQILCGVHVMHAAQTLHRDLKPKNILVNQDLTTKICDLGMGRGKMTTNSSLKMTLLSRVATASYRAPDGILNISGPLVSVDVQTTNTGEFSHYTKAVDVWACGCIMAEMITGSPLFPHKDNHTLLSAFVDLLGCPATALLERIPQSQALTQLKQIMTDRKEESSRPRLPDLFPAEESTDALDLCLKLLDFDPFSRISIADALKHPYFDDFDEFDVPLIQKFVDPTNNPSLNLQECSRLIIAAADSIITA
jgi:mitogen-activated protein kinase 7